MHFIAPLRLKGLEIIYALPSSQGQFYIVIFLESTIGSQKPDRYKTKKID